MFGLIPMVMTIILAGVVTLSMVYMSGDIYSGSSESANSQGYINEADQVLNAIELYQFENGGDLPASLSDITTNKRYVRSIDGSWSFVSKGIGLQIEGPSCEAINEAQGYTGSIPDCSALPAALTGKRYYCCNQ